MKQNRSWASGACAALVAALVSACGGGGSNTTPAAAITSVKVMGDSLADSGTFGFKFTVNGTSSQIYPERIAATYGLTLCNAYVATGASTFIPNPAQAGCTNYAIGGGRINNYSAPTSPLSIVQQLKDASAAGDYTAGDLLVIDGGGNDAADLVGAFLNAPADGGAAYIALLGTVLPPATIGAAVSAGQPGLERVGATYLSALADNFHAAIQTHALDQGAQRIAVLNMPGITNTPRFRMVLDSIAAAYGGGAAGASARAHALGVFDSWITAFNTELATKFAGNANVVVVDFHASFDDEVANPGLYALQNVATPACPITGVGSDGLPTYTFPTCTDAALSAVPPPTGATGGADWWKSYAFSDGFHPTPYGHDLLARYISRSLAQAGWL
ncbi:SGNH/GDSL hydrolase family protein [Rhizobacter sp. Root404]|uniref:SGNH/GDSL hydrolase family protein n=1 Tax=Rhizobacter sp. Root404 TaxID=1736528 RepID=UPI0006F3DCDD|nr:SGNH/GDSL hydrolase family protein [Rhizobacter sp. Root404]KQW39901.1 phospholipase [Rhizobacter sp. Root404]